MKLKHFQETGDLEDCISTTLHHTDSGAFQFAPGSEPNQHGWQRVGSIADGLRKALLQIRKIKGLAEKRMDEELLQILDEKFQFGLPGKEVL